MNISSPMPQRLLALLDGHHADHIVAMLGTLAATVFRSEKYKKKKNDEMSAQKAFRG